jgi:lipoprotein-anchoring transpeptidase ErfK/SrfK
MATSGRRRVRAAVGAGIALWLAGLPLAPAGASGSAPQVERLEKRGKLSYHAFVDERVNARVRPDSSARVISRLGLRTQDGTAELVLVLARTIGEEGSRWLKVRLPMRPNGTTGWVPETALGGLQPSRKWIYIDRDKLRITLENDGREVLRAEIGIGQPQWPTPRGQFYVRSQLKGYGGAGSFYGPVAFGTSAYSPSLTDWPAGGIVGIHGTSVPQLIPGRISHGCVRLRNRDILRLARRITLGTPVTIR